MLKVECSSQPEDRDASLPSLEYIPVSLSSSPLQKGFSHRQKQSPPVNTHRATTSPLTFLSNNETSSAFQEPVEETKVPISASSRTVFVSFKQPHSPNTVNTENLCSNIMTSDPFALPLHSHRQVSNFTSTTTRRQSDAGSMHYPPYSYNRGGNPKRRFSLDPEHMRPTYPYLDSQVGFIDTHCHIDMMYGKLGLGGTFNSFQRLYRSSFPSEFRGCIADFCNPKIMMKQALWEGLLGEDMVWGAFGCHPHFANEYSSVHERNILMAMRHPKAVAFGEMGLDYSHKNSTSVSRQKEASSYLTKPLKYFLR